jgi:cell division septation protein DedD
MESRVADVLLTRVRVGPFADRWAAAAKLREMEARGYKPFIAAEPE